MLGIIKKCKNTLQLVLSTEIILFLFTACNNASNVKDEISNTRLVTPKPLNTHTKAFNPEPNIDNMLNNISSLASFERPMGSQGEIQGCTYLKGVLNSYGYLTHVQAFPYDLEERALNESDFWNIEVPEKNKDGEGQNLIAEKTSENNTKDVIVISAHYDSNGLGLIDNATGVSVLMETARLFSDISLSVNVRFILFSGEEMGLKGSRYYLGKLSNNEKQNILANINLDYIGEEGKNNLILATIDGKENAATKLFEEFTKSGKVNIIKAPISDYYSFAKAGISSLSIGQLPIPWEISNGEKLTKEEMQNELKKYDSITRLNHDKLKSAINMVISVLSKCMEEKPGT
jgi:Zn-dependent M28 family amino/carboxypeptidase